jgi:protein associated with RNAse G/E
MERAMPGVMAPGEQTAVHVTKHDGTYHRRIPAVYVRGAPPLHVLHYEAGMPVARTPALADDPDPYITEWDTDLYLFEDRWYDVHRCVRDARTLFYANIASPARLDEQAREFHYVDYDYDIWWWADGEPEVLDEDEFLDHAARMRYPAPVIELARAAVDEVLEMMKARAFPFDRA